jgi:hypothetical protein
MLRVIALCLACSVDVGLFGLEKAERDEGESTIDLREHAIIDLALAIVRHQTSARTSNHGVVFSAYNSNCRASSYLIAGSHQSTIFLPQGSQ